MSHTISHGDAVVAFTSLVKAKDLHKQLEELGKQDGMCPAHSMRVPVGFFAKAKA